MTLTPRKASTLRSLLCEGGSVVYREHAAFGEARQKEEQCCSRDRGLRELVCWPYLLWADAPPRRADQGTSITACPARPRVR